MMGQKMGQIRNVVLIVKNSVSSQILLRRIQMLDGWVLLSCHHCLQLLLQVIRVVLLVDYRDGCPLSFRHFLGHLLSTMVKVNPYTQPVNWDVRILLLVIMIQKLQRMMGVVATERKKIVVYVFIVLFFMIQIETSVVCKNHVKSLCEMLVHVVQKYQFLILLMCYLQL